MQERLQKIISASGLMSRRAAEQYIAQGRVSVNGTAAELGQKADREKDRILVDGKALPSKEKMCYIMLNKPRGYVTSMKDEKGRKDVTELTKELGLRLYPVGRLDMYSEGLLIMTNDGDLANMLMHTSNEIKKTYYTWVTGEDIGPKIEYLREPMLIDDYMIKPAEVDIVDIFPGGALLSISICEGRNRQVRKMCAEAGLKVTRLKRVSEGCLQLGELKCGHWRYLSDEELRMIKEHE